MIGHHLDYDVLADLAEGLLDEQTEASVQAHLESCDECSQRSDELLSVSQLLASAPMPAMPESLAARLDAAILAEAEHAPVVNLTARRRLRNFQMFSAAAAVIVVSGVGLAIAVPALQSADSNDSAARLEAPGSQEKPMIAPDEEFFLSSGTDYKKASLVEQISEKLRHAGLSRTQTLTLSTQLDACVKQITGEERLLFVDKAKFEGQEATIIVLAPRTGPKDVWIVGPKCSADIKDTIERVKVPV